MGARRTGSQVAGSNGADFLEGRRMPPNLHKLFATKISAGQRELHAGKNIAVRRDVTGGVARTAGISVHYVFVRSCGWSTKFSNVANQFFVLENAAQLSGGRTQSEDGGVAVDLGRDGRIQGIGNA